jgi:ATP-dependent RNA helicase DDX24/MAK5
MPSATKPLLKRKAPAPPLRARKKTRVARASAPVELGALPWRQVARRTDVVDDADDGILELEEVEDVEVVYEDTPGGRVATFRVREVVRDARCRC